MCRDEKNFPHPTYFIPERWYSVPELITNKQAFAPFGCIGKNLPLAELRTLTASSILEFGVKFAPGEDGSRLLQDTVDNFTVDCGRLELEFCRI